MVVVRCVAHGNSVYLGLRSFFGARWRSLALLVVRLRTLALMAPAALFCARWRSLALVCARLRSLVPTAFVCARWRSLALVGACWHSSSIRAEFVPVVWLHENSGRVTTGFAGQGKNNGHLDFGVFWATNRLPSTSSSPVWRVEWYKLSGTS